MNLNYKQRAEFPEKDEPPQADSPPTLTVLVCTPPGPVAPGGGTTCDLVQPTTCNVQPSLVAPERSGGGTFNSPLPPPPLDALRARVISCLRAAIAKPVLLLRIRPLSENDWQLFLQHTEYFAEAEIHGYCWREVSEGVMPSGYDAGSIAAEAVEEVFREVEAGCLAPNLKELKRALRRCARKIINRLHHRMENEVMVSECDLNPIFKDYGEVIAPLEMFPGEEPDASEVLMAKEDAAEFEQLKHQFKALLDRDQLLKDLFACLCAGIVKREAIARKLGLPVKAIKNAQECLNRHVAEFKERKKV